MNNQQEVELFRDSIFAAMIDRKPKVYKPFLTVFKAGVRPPLFPNHVREVFLSFYAAMRYIDDVVDGDSVPEVPIGKREDYVMQRLQVLRNRVEGVDIADRHMTHAFTEGDAHGIDMRKEAGYIIQSMLFDAKRVGQHKIFSRAELQMHFFDLDIEGTIKGCLKLFGEDPEKYRFVQPAGEASRIYYNLRDLEEDFAEGYINIPSEEIRDRNISRLDLHRAANGDISGPIQAWKEREKIRGITELARYDNVIRKASLNWKTRVAIGGVFNLPARRYFLGKK